MKLYNPEPTYFIRLQIIRQGDQTEYINLVETTMEETISFCKELIDKQGISPFQVGKVTSINVREATGGQNGISKTLSFKGLSPRETHDLIIKNIKDS